MLVKSSIKGFPELLPNERIFENQVLDSVRNSFELHGFANIETASIEAIDSLLQKGETSKEIYAVSRLQQGDSDGERAKIGLHYDLTIPFARYVAANLNDLVFPFKRYQIQKVWRGERPQAGRFREFTQADIDIIGRNSLSPHLEIEIASAISFAFQALNKIGVPKVTFHLNSRVLLEAIFRKLEISGELHPEVSIIIDKSLKIGAGEASELLAELGLSSDQITHLLEIIQISAESKADFKKALEQHIKLETPEIEEINKIDTFAKELAAGSGFKTVFDLSLARGLDYYTGIVFETYLNGFETAGSVCSGGRYDSLIEVAHDKYPGIGISIGVTRLISVMLGNDLVKFGKSSPADILITVISDDERKKSVTIAKQLRGRGIKCEVSPISSKFGDQIAYAAKLGIKYVWFIDPENSVKNIITGEQSPADPALWQPS